MGSLETLVLVMQIFSLFIVAAGAYLCLVHAGVLPAKRALGGFAIAASCVLFGAALGAVALSLAMRSAPVEAAAYAEPGWDAPRVMPLSTSVPLVASGTIVHQPAAASILWDTSLLRDADFRVYEYH